jgi:hypothetical protein
MAPELADAARNVIDANSPEVAIDRVSRQDIGRAFGLNDVQGSAVVRLYRATVSEHWVLIPGRDPDRGSGVDRSELVSLDQAKCLPLQMGLRFAAVTPQPRPLLLLDHFVHMPEVGASSPFGMGLVLVVAVLRHTGYHVCLLDGLMHVPEIGASSPLRMALVLRALVDPHRPHLPQGGTPTVVGDRSGPLEQSSQQGGPVHHPVRMKSLLGTRSSRTRLTHRPSW